MSSAAGPREAPGPSDDPSGFDAFYKSQYARAVRFAWLLTGSEVAEDLVQEAFLSVEREFPQLEQPLRYLMKTVVNRARTWQRDERRRRLKLTRVQPETAVFDKPRDADLLAAVSELPYRQRAVVVMRYWAGWTEAEIAVALGCRAGTVKSLSSRALRRLRGEVTP